MPDALSGLNGLAGINALSVDTPEASPEERNGGPADDYHGHWGEQAGPYAWESSLAMGGSHGPYGPENQMLGDEMWFCEPAGDAQQDPTHDYNTPNLTKSHASVHNVTISGGVPSQSEAIHNQISQMGNHGSNLGTSRAMQTDQQGYAVQDVWVELENITPGNEQTPRAPGSISNQAGGWGANDHAENSYRKQNGWDLGSAHFHRRYAAGSIPGNYMWMRPGGRPMFKTLAGPARPAVGENSPFHGDDLGNTFAYDTGAVLQSQPTQYVPPPEPYLAAPVAATDTASDQGTDGTDLW
jgi:hypothetical protein